MITQLKEEKVGLWNTGNGKTKSGETSGDLENVGHHKGHALSGELIANTVNTTTCIFENAEILKSTRNKSIDAHQVRGLFHLRYLPYVSICSNMQI